VPKRHKKAEDARRPRTNDHEHPRKHTHTQTNANVRAQAHGSMTRSSLVKLMERVATVQRQKQDAFLTQAWDGVSKVLRKEEKRGGKIIKALSRAEQKTLERKTNPLLKVDKFTKQKHHKRERQMAKVLINEELRNMVR